MAHPQPEKTNKLSYSAHPTVVWRGCPSPRLSFSCRQVPAEVRPYATGWVPGNRITASPFGGRGLRVDDYLSDLETPARENETQWVVGAVRTWR